MISNNIQVNNAYLKALDSVSDKQAKTDSLLGIGNEGGGNFGAMVSDTVNKVVSTGQAADSKMMSQAVGKVDVVDVVTAVAETEIAIQTLVSVRDRVISAYQDILRMPI
ncbi:MAG: flagellar hook-basal body complex protein FliE [Rhizobiales bacterium]|nr:flagellar hook-basal body complex protein FliE [Hyphomicrobiales bacterium]